MDLLAECKNQYRITIDASYRRRDYPQKWQFCEIAGKDGALWPYNDSHLVVAFFHSWRTRHNAHGDVVWIPARRSRKAKRFQKVAGRDCEVVQDCDEATSYKVPNKYLHKALKLIDALQKRRLSRDVKANLSQASKSRGLFIAGRGLTEPFLNDLPTGEPKPLPEATPGSGTHESQDAA